MNKQVAADLIAVLGRSTDKTLIHKCLLTLRADLVGRNRAGIELFYRLNGIPPLVRLISKPYEKIIDVALSILANCCVSKSCCRQAIAQGVVPPLLSILRSIPSTSVQCRACRLLGNLARESNEKLCGLAKGIGVAIAALLADTGDVNTLNMAVRAARLLWNEMPFYDEFVRHGGVQKIVHILIAQTKRVRDGDGDGNGGGGVTTPAADGIGGGNHMDIHVKNIQFMELVNSKVFDREILKKEPARSDTDLFSYPDAATAPQHKDRRELIAELMRSLQALTGRLSFRIVHDVFAVEHSCHCIVYFARHDSPLRAVALRILSNLAKSVPASAEFLSKADAITAACRLITQARLEPRLTEVEERHCIAVICFLAGDACNRAKIRRSGAFTRIMEIAKRTQCDALLTSILMGLQNFRYDNNSIDQMIGVGLVSVLVERLERLTRDMSDVHVKRVMKRPAPVEAEEEGEESGWTASAAGGEEGEGDADDETTDRASGDDGADDSAGANKPVAKRRLIESSPVPSQSYYSNPGSPCSSGSMSPTASRSPGRGQSSADGGGDAAATTEADDMDSEYSPVCSDIEEPDAEDGTAAMRALSATTTTAATESKKRAAVVEPCAGQSPEVMRLLDECSTAMVDESIESDDDDSDTTKTDSTLQLAASPDAAAKMKTVNLIIDTLCNVSLRLKYATDLCTAPILSTLVRACRVAYRRREVPTPWASGAPQVLFHIVEETMNFVPIIKQDIIFKIYEMTQIQEDHEDCSQCNDLKQVGDGLLGQLITVGETGYGRGEMARMLLRGDRRTHTQIAIVTTYIIRQPKYLHTLLVEHGGLYTVMECILSKRSPGADADAKETATTSSTADDTDADTGGSRTLAADAATGLTALAQVLDISVPASDELLIERSPGFALATEYTTRNAPADGNAAPTSDDERTIWFVAGDAADDDSSQRVAFDRARLVAYSDVFASMLQNDFRESHEKQIRLRRQTLAGIRYFLDGVQQLSTGRRLRRPSPEQITAVLETYDMAQVYLLPELERSVYNMILHLLSPQTALAVFEFAMREHKAQLADVAVAYYLGCRVSGERKVRMYREADESEFFAEWSQMMLDTVVYTCQNRISK